jgi:hypothetical protein
MPVPDLDDDDRRRALDKAAAARRARAELKADLRTGKVTLAEVLARADHDDVVGRTKVAALLESLPNVGKVRAQRLMERLEISPTRRLRGLGANQRQRLLQTLADDRAG